MDRSRNGGNSGGGLSGGKKTAFVQRPGLGALLQRGQPQQQQQQQQQGWNQSAASAREERRGRLEAASGEQPSLARVQQEQMREEQHPPQTARNQQQPIRDLGQRQSEPQQSREEQERNARLAARELGPAHLRSGNQGAQAHRGERPSSAAADGGRSRGGRQDWRSRPASAGQDSYGGGGMGGRYSERDQFGGRPSGRGGRGSGGYGGSRGGRRGGFDRRDVVVKSAQEFGVVALLKEDKGFGFIKSPAAVENLFFHVSRLVNQRDWPSERVSVGDECQFELVADRSGNLSADMIRSAPEGSAVFERINATGVTGTITKDLRNVRSPFAGRNNSGAVDKFEGRVQYTPEGSEQSTEIEYGFADIDSINAQLWEGDEVTFDVVDDLRFKRRIASNFSLVKCSRAERMTGIVDKVADGFGFVECAERNVRLFFHFKEILQDEHSEHGGIRARSEIEFNITSNHQQGKDKEIAIRVVSLPRGTVKFEELVAQKVQGKVLKVESVSARQAQQQQQGRQQQSRFSNRARATTQGEIEVSGDGDEKHVIPFIGKNVRFDQVLKPGDEVQLDVILDKRSQQRYALNIVLQTPVAEGREQGLIESVKDTFGFIDAFGEYRKIFFHQSNVLRGKDGKMIEVEPGTEVEFDVDISGTSNRDAGDPRGQHSQQQHDKANALRIVVLPRGTIQMVTEIKSRQTGYVGREAQPPGSVRRDEERNGKINFEEMPDGTRPYAVYGLADITGSAEALAAEAKDHREKEDDRNMMDEQPESEPTTPGDDHQSATSVKVVEVSLVPERGNPSAVVAPIRKGEEVLCDIMLDKRDPGHRFASRISVVWTTGVVKSAPRATGGFGQVNAPDRDMKDLKFHWTEQLGAEARALEDPPPPTVPLVADEAVKFILCKNQMGHYSAHSVQRLEEPLPEAIAAAESARAAFEAAASANATKSEAAAGTRHQESTANVATSHVGSGSVNANERDEKVSRLVARGPDGTKGFHTTVDGKRWTGVEAWVDPPQPEPELDPTVEEFVPSAP